MALLDFSYPSPGRAWSAALAMSSLGGTLVLALVVWLNESAKAPDRRDEILTTPMELAQTPPKPTSRPKPKPRRKTETKRLKPIPAPDLGANLSGMDFGLPDIGLNFGMDERLLGENQAHVGQEGFDTPPQPVTTGSFSYPAEAKKRSIQGYVLLSVFVDERGEVTEAQVLESSPPGVFDASALEGIRRWRFNPARSQSKPVATWIQQKIVFQLG